MNRFEICIFDWDGTLVDSEKHIVDSLTYAASKLMLPELAYSTKKNIIGLSMQKALSTLYPDLSERDIEVMRQHYADYFFSVSQDASILFNGVIETLTALSNSGVRLAVATGKSRHGLDKALHSTGLKRFFEIERCADETRSKPDPLMLEEIAQFFQTDFSKIVMVGDTEYDLAMANNIAMPSVAVSYGVHESERLALHKPLAIIDSITELPSIIQIK